MAKRSFSPVVWFLLALTLRADMDAAGQTRYSASSTGKTTNSTTTTIAPARWKSPRQTAVRATAADQRATSVKSPTVDYAISGEPYQSDAYTEEASMRQATSRRTPASRAAPARVYEDREFEAKRQPELAEYQVDYDEEPRNEMEAMSSRDSESDYIDEMYAEEYWGEEQGYEGGRHAPPSRFFHWLHSFTAEHGYWFRTSTNSPPHIGMGQPLKGTSWLNRPNSISFFAGILNGDELISNRVDQGSALFGGLRLGWDFDHYWGVEVRAGWASPDIEFPSVPPNRVDGIFLSDAEILYYPWGDAACRPYALVGMGMARFDFTDDVGVVHDEYLLGIPFGFGFKYQYHPNLVFRAEFLDNTAWGSSGLNNMNNLSFSLGMELRFGGKPRSYYPWQPAKYIW